MFVSFYRIYPFSTNVQLEVTLRQFFMVASAEPGAGSEDEGHQERDIFLSGGGEMLHAKLQGC